MATKTFKRGQTLPTRTAYEERRRGRDFTFAGEQPRAEAQQPTFEEQANISTYAGPAISISTFLRLGFVCPLLNVLVAI